MPTEVQATKPANEIPKPPMSVEFGATYAQPLHLVENGRAELHSGDERFRSYQGLLEALARGDAQARTDITRLLLNWNARDYLGVETSNDILAAGETVIAPGETVVPGETVIAEIASLFFLYETINKGLKPVSDFSVIRTSAQVQTGVDLPLEWGFLHKSESEKPTGVIPDAYYEQNGIIFRDFDRTIQSLADAYFQIGNITKDADEEIDRLWTEWESYTANKAESFFQRNFDRHGQGEESDTPVARILSEFKNSLLALTGGLHAIAHTLRNKTRYVLNLYPKLVTLRQNNFQDAWKTTIQIANGEPTDVDDNAVLFMSQHWELTKGLEPADVGSLAFSGAYGDISMYPPFMKQYAHEVARQKVAEFEAGFRGLMFEFREKCTATRAEIQEQLNTMAAELLETEPAKFEYLD